MFPTVRTTLLVIALAFAALLAAGCRSAPTAAEESPKAPAAETAPDAAKTGTEPAADEIRPSGPGVGAYALTVPKNVVWWPWKAIGGAGKGAFDGVFAGFDKGRMPLAGLIFSPVNLVAGFVTGLVEGIAMPPGVIGPTQNFGKTMASPTRRTTTIWWYP